MLKENELSLNKKVVNNTPWSIPVTKEEIEKARNCLFNITLTAHKIVPRNWFHEELKNKSILCITSGGSEQGAILAALGALVTVFDISNNHLIKDEKISKKNNLIISTVEGDIVHLKYFKNNHFDLVFFPVSLVYIKDMIPVFKECHRVLKTGGRFLFGCVNPLNNLIGAQTSVGFIIEDFYEDVDDEICKYIATKSIKI